MSATDELGAMAESIVLVMPQAATLMMEAADTICELRNRCNNLVDERERLFRANVEKNGEILRLVKENAKLRELCGELAGELHALGVDFNRIGWCFLRDELRELGIEVD